MGPSSLPDWGPHLWRRAGRANKRPCSAYGRGLGGMSALLVIADVHNDIVSYLIEGALNEARASH
jgi:hypothetical protein